MANWASDVATGTVNVRGRDAVEAGRVALSVEGDPVLVQWSLSYQAIVNVGGLGADRGGRVRVRTVVGLERDGVELARWLLGQDQAQSLQDPAAQARNTGTASGLFVDRTPGVGSKTYVLKVWNELASRWATLTVGTRAMVCEQR